MHTYYNAEEIESVGTRIGNKAGTGLIGVERDAYPTSLPSDGQVLVAVMDNGIARFAADVSDLVEYRYFSDPGEGLRTMGIYTVRKDQLPRPYDAENRSRFSPSKIAQDSRPRR